MMTKEEWDTATCASHMLERLHLSQPEFLNTQVPQLHKFFIACCWKHKHLMPQQNLRNGLLGAEAWIKGEINYDELNKLNWYAEAEAFGIDYAESEDEIAELKSLIESVKEIRDLPFAQARERLRKAAYFAELSMIYPAMRSLPWINGLFTSQFLCANLLREFIIPPFDISS